jgi:DNA-binding CsgD family transcriptional regulator
VQYSNLQATSVAALTMHDRLTAQEQACLRLVARRLSSKQIAAELGIAKTSVDTYCNRARRKLGVSDRYAAARLVVTQTVPEASATSPPAPVARPRRVASAPLGLAAAALIAVALGVGSLLAGMTALEALKPPGWGEKADKAVTSPQVVARAD